MAAAAIARLAGRCVVYATPQHDVVMDTIINRSRRALGMEVLLAAHGDRRGGVAAMRAVKDGAPLGLLADQGTSGKRGPCISWGNRPSDIRARHSSRVAATRRSPGVVVRTGAGRFRFYTGRPLESRRRHRRRPARQIG